MSEGKENQQALEANQLLSQADENISSSLLKNYEDLNNAVQTKLVEVSELKEEVRQDVTKVSKKITNVEAITVLGFILAIVTLVGVVIAGVAFVSDQVHQTNAQTQLLQQINDKINK